MNLRACSDAELARLAADVAAEFARRAARVAAAAAGGADLPTPAKRALQQAVEALGEGEHWTGALTFAAVRHGVGSEENVARVLRGLTSGRAWRFGAWCVERVTSGPTATSYRVTRSEALRSAP